MTATMGTIHRRTHTLTTVYARVRASPLFAMLMIAVRFDVFLCIPMRVKSAATMALLPYGWRAFHVRRWWAYKMRVNVRKIPFGDVYAHRPQSAYEPSGDEGDRVTERYSKIIKPDNCGTHTHMGRKSCGDEIWNFIHGICHTFPLAPRKKWTKNRVFSLLAEPSQEIIKWHHNIQHNISEAGLRQIRNRCDNSNARNSFIKSWKFAACRPRRVMWRRPIIKSIRWSWFGDLRAHVMCILWSAGGGNSSKKLVCICHTQIAWNIIIQIQRSKYNSSGNIRCWI